MINIVADSCCDLRETIKTDEYSFVTVPFTFEFDNASYVDDDSIDINALLNSIETCKEAGKTACPPAGMWYEYFKQEGDAIAVTISSNLSGSYNSACAAKQMILEEFPDKKVAVIDVKSTGPENAMTINHMIEDIKNHKSFEEVVDGANEFARVTHTIFTLSSFNNLIKNGRMSAIKGLIAEKLGFWGIGIGSDEGTIEVIDKVRGEGKTARRIVEVIKENRSGNLITISHVNNIDMANRIKDELLAYDPNIKIDILETRGLDSFYAERGGIIIGY